MKSPCIDKGKEACESYYQHLYKERWDTLYSHLVQKKLFVPVSEEISNISIPQDDERDHAHIYYIDYASKVAVEIIYAILQKHSCTHLLDMCAAPGGKALALLFKHSTFAIPEDNPPLSLTLNDKSKKRFFILKKNIQDFFYKSLTQPIAQSSLKIEYSNLDGNLFGKHYRHSFDLVVLDAPCSNSKHIFQDNTLLSQWNSKKYKRLANMQTSLLCAAIDSCKENGMIVYMTCSINPMENELCINKVLKKRDIKVLNTLECISPCSHISHNNSSTTLETSHTSIPRLVLETLPYGHIILPDQSQGAGPLYICVLQKNTSNAGGRT